MKKPIAMLCVLLCGSAAFAAGDASDGSSASSTSSRRPDPKQTAQCNSEARAKGLKRAERKAFLKTCMEGVANSTVAPRSLSGKDQPALETAKP